MGINSGRINVGVGTEINGVQYFRTGGNMFYLWWQNLIRVSNCVYRDSYPYSDTWRILVFCKITITYEQWDQWDEYY